MNTETHVPSTPTSRLSLSASESGIQLRYTHLPTPQSPSNFAQYVPSHTQAPESPLPPSSKQSFLTPMSSQSKLPMQMMTPDSSPFSRRTPNAFEMSPTQPNSPLLSTPIASSTAIQLDLLPSKTPPLRSPSEPVQLDSPFNAKVSQDDPFAPVPMTPPSMSTPPTSPPQPLAQPHGGEMERLRQTMMQDKLNQIQELENRRPDYLKRMKRSLTDMDDEVVRDTDRFGAIGITETPNKGRRLKLFQETSEESFEESLMAGGYGRYRTAEWVRQPQPLVLSQTGAPVMTLLEEQQQPLPVEEPPPPPSEKEIKTRKRLASFRTDHEGASIPSRLFPVELEGKGRVLLDIPHESSYPESSSKKRSSVVTSTRRSRRKADTPPKEQEDASLPNWPDGEFPWRLRKEERREMVKAEESERLRWIEKFFKRDSDEEDDEVVAAASRGEEEEVIPSSKWGVVYEDDTDRPTPSRRGRGKMVPLRGDPEQSTKKRSAYFPSDPADARAALLSKRTVRALSYRQQRRRRLNRTSEETVCICRGTDDGRELVQCDDCKTWFHLECLGIGNVSELGREEDPWFCHDCAPGSASSASEPEEMETREPTFVPTDETPRMRRVYDLEGAVPDSPAPNWGSTRMPKTPVTPRRQAGVRVYTTPGPLDGIRGNDDFDPTSTPSRGITFNGPFNTPKWNRTTRAKTFGGAGFLSATLDQSPNESPYREHKTPQARRILDPSRPVPPRFELPVSPRSKGKERGI